MAEEIEFRLKFNDEELLNGLDRTKTATNEIKEGIDEVNKSSADLGKTLTESANQANEGFEDLNGGVLSSSRILDQFLAKIKIGGTNLKELKDNFTKLTGESNKASKSMQGVGQATQTAAKSVGVLGKAFNILKSLIAASGIGIAVTAIAALGAFAKKTAKDMMLLEKSMAAINAISNTLNRRLESLGEFLVASFKGQTLRSVEAFKNAFFGLGNEIKTVYNNSIELVQAAKDLEDAYRAFGLTQVKAQGEIDRLLDIANDDTKTYEERLDAANKAKERSIALAEQEEILARENLKNAQQTFDLSKKEGEDKDALVNAQILYEKAVLSTQKAQREGDKVIKGINEERLKEIEQERQRIEKLKETYEKLVDKFNEATEKIDFAKLSPKDQAKAVLDQSLAEIDLAADVIRETAKKLGMALPEGFEEGVKTQKAEAERIFRESLKEIFPPAEELPNLLDEESLAKLLGIKKEQIDPVVQEYWGKGIIDFQNSVKSLFKKKFGLKDNEELKLAFDYISAGAQSVFGSLQDIVTSNFEAALNKADQEIAAIQERIQGVNSALEEERRKQQAGYANDVALLENKLKQENQALAKAERDKIEIQKKQARQQLVIDSAIQASQIVVGISKLIASEASKGLIGIFTATSGIALLFSLLAKSKAQANSLSQVPKFREGTEYLQGKSHEQGGVLIEAEGGERILSKKLNSKLRMTNEELVDFAILGQNMTRKLGLLAQENRSTLHQYELMNAMMQREAISESIYGAMNQNADRVIGYWQTRPVIIPTSNGTIAESWEGSTKVRRKYRAI